MKRILITGMSGTGKSTVVRALAARGFRAVDLDCDEYSEWIAVSDDSQQPGTPVEADRDWVWRAERVQELLSTADGEVLFVSGCASNMGKFRRQFEHMVLLSAAALVVVQRLQTRDSNPYGNHPDQQALVLSLIEAVEPLLRRSADHEIDTGDTNLNNVIEQLVQLAEQ